MARTITVSDVKLYETLITYNDDGTKTVRNAYVYLDDQGARIADMPNKVVEETMDAQLFSEVLALSAASLAGREGAGVMVARDKVSEHLGDLHKYLSAKLKAEEGLDA